MNKTLVGCELIKSLVGDVLGKVRKTLHEKWKGVFFDGKNKEIVIICNKGDLMKQTKKIVLSLIVLKAIFFQTIAYAEIYPNKPIRLVVGDAPGGSPDTLGRILAQKVSERVGQPIVIDNKAGASGIVAAEIVAKAPADGYTLLLNTTSLWAILPNLKKNLPYDNNKSFVHITQIATATNVMVINLKHPAKTLKELIQYGKVNPGKLNYASAGIASPAHLAGEMLGLYADIKMTHVAYKGAGPALLDVIAGNVDFIITSPIAAGPHMNSGRVRALGSTGTQRNPALPDLPSMSETVAGYDMSQSWGLSAPAGTPADVIQLLHTEFERALKLPDVQEKIRSTGAIAIGNSPQAFESFMANERKRLGEVIAKTGIILSD